MKKTIIKLTKQKLWEALQSQTELMFHVDQNVQYHLVIKLHTLENVET